MWPLLSSARKRWLDRKSAAQWVGLAVPAAPVKLHSGTNGGHILCCVCRKGQWARLRQQSLQPSVVDLGSRGAAAPGSCHARCLQMHTSCWFVHGESFSGCLRSGAEMSNPVFCRLVVTAREVAFLIYYTGSNLQGVPGCQQECVVNVSLMGSECCVCIL